MGKENIFTQRFDEIYKDYTINLDAFSDLDTQKEKEV